MNPPKVKEGDWIIISPDETGVGIDGYVFSVQKDGILSVGYYQNKIKAIKEDVVWDGNNWKFKYTGPNGTYLSGADEAIVKRGPRL